MQYLHPESITAPARQKVQEIQCREERRGGKEEEEMRGRGRDRDKRIEMNEILFNCQIVEVTI